MAENEKPIPKSFIHVEFSPNSSVQFDDFRWENVHPLQLIALGEYLMLMGRTQIEEFRQMQLRQMQEANVPKIFVPGRKT